MATEQMKMKKKHHYLELLPKIRRIAKRHGYAVGVHGSQTRDFDLIMIPWVDKCSSPLILLDAIMKGIDGKQGDEFGVWKPHGRKSYSILLNNFFRTGCYLDISFPSMVDDHINFKCGEL
jgi:hypothetical protein